MLTSPATGVEFPEFAEYVDRDFADNNLPCYLDEIRLNKELEEAATKNKFLTSTRTIWNSRVRNLDHHQYKRIIWTITPTERHMRLERVKKMQDMRSVSGFTKFIEEK